MKTIYAETKYDLAGYVIQLNLKVEPCIYVPDRHSVRRTWKERLFERPWKPTVKRKSVYRPVAYVIEWQGTQSVIVSLETYDALINSGYKPSTPLPI